MRTRHLEVYGPGELGHEVEWRWRVRGANGRVQGQGEAYTRRRDAVNAVLDIFKGTGLRVDVYGADGGVDRVTRCKTADEVVADSLAARTG